MNAKSLMMGGMVALAALACACPNAVPEFKLSDHRGGQWTGASFTKRPTILVFLKKDCPANPRAIPLLNGLQKQLGETAQVVGVVNADLSNTRAYAANLKAEFPLLADAQSVLIKGFSAKRSLQFSVVATKAEPRWAKVWDGIGQTEVEAAIKLITAHGHQLAPVELKSLPSRAMSGCGF